MSNSICTLFEGNYHHGVAALTNSLYKCGFRGDIYVGYRGDLPKWASKTTENEKLLWLNAKTLSLEDGINLHFLPLDTDYHLTNFKPDFMLALFNSFQLDGLLYFDPDIVVSTQFKNLERWIDCGIAVSEDVNSPLQEFHPRRVYWRKYYKKYNYELCFKNSIYVNGGFVGLRKNEIQFLLLWRDLQEKMAFEIGGLNRSAFLTSNDVMDRDYLSDDYPFSRTDQDALNAALEAYRGSISYSNKAVMAFEDGLALMPHALGHYKPWLTNYFIEFLKGNKPRLVDKLYWSSLSNPLKVFSVFKIFSKKLTIKVLSFASRFYSK